MPTHRMFLIVLIVLSLLTMVAQAQQSTIAGVVEASGRPLVGVLVGAQVETNSSAGPLPSAVTARSDQNGAFRLTGLKPGKYILMILSPGWVILGDIFSGPSVKEVRVIADETIENLRLSLVKGGVVTGRVTTEDGQPLIGVSVNLTPAGRPGRMTLVARFDQIQSSKNMTDDRGIYRIYGLQPGKYLVSVGSAGSGRDPIPLTYYPVGSEKGEPVTVKEGEETTGIDLTIREDKPTYLIQGRLLDALGGQPVSNVPIKYGVQNPSGGSFSALATHSNAKGAFLIDGLRPGKYTIVAGGDERSGYYSEPLSVEVTDQDVTGLELQIMSSASISGTVVVEGESGVITPEALGRLLLRAQVVGAEIGANRISPIPIGPNGVFEARGLSPGKIQLSLLGQEDSREWWLTGIVHRGELVTGGIPLQAGEQVIGIQIRVMRGTGSIKGRVVIPEGLINLNLRIEAYAQPAERGRTRITQMQPTPIGNDGTFKITGLVPGPYVLRLLAPGGPEQVVKLLSRARETVIVNQNAESPCVLTIAPENK